MVAAMTIMTQYMAIISIQHPFSKHWAPLGHLTSFESGSITPCASRGSGNCRLPLLLLLPLELKPPAILASSCPAVLLLGTVISSSVDQPPLRRNVRKKPGAVHLTNDLLPPPDGFTPLIIDHPLQSSQICFCNYPLQ